MDAKTCSVCNLVKDEFVRNRCKDCSNEARRLKYSEDEEHRKLLIQQATTYKQRKLAERRQAKEDLIGKDNKQCKYCDVIKHKTAFRYNRLKCRTCERDEPLDKFKRSIRSRIYTCLTKNKSTNEYLGCGSSEYLRWILENNDGFTLANRGKEWHIDHVIPLSKFDLNDEDEVLIAFNWRNTMPLSAKDNMSKNNKIIPFQIEQHVAKLKEYHTKHNIELPQEYIDLFARHLAVREVP